MESKLTKEDAAELQAMLIKSWIGVFGLGVVVGLILSKVIQ